MATSPTARITELEAVVRVLAEQIAVGRREVEKLESAKRHDDTTTREAVVKLETPLTTLTETVIRFGERLDQLRREVGTSGVADLRQELALVRQSCADQQKRMDTWDTRLWGVVAGVLLLLMSSVVTLVIAVTRK